MVRMSGPQLVLGGAFLGAAALAAAGVWNPGSDFAAPGEWLALAVVEGPVMAGVLEVVDGDTFEARAAIWLGQSIEIRVRIAGVDAPELHAHCDSKRTKALAAKAWLERRIAGATVRLSAIRHDKYGGRVDAEVQDRQGDVGKALIATGLARPYRGGRRQSWCRTA